MIRSAPARAMVLAAGLGERLRPITETTPKPLVPVHGRPIIDGILDRLGAAGVETAVVNLHHLGDKLRRHLEARDKPPAVLLSPEEELLDTAGGVIRALPLLGEEPFFVVNGDIVWLDGVRPALLRLASGWDAERMDALLLLHPTSIAVGYEGKGDFMLDPLGTIRWRKEREVAPFVYAGLQIVHPRLFAGCEGGRRSFRPLWSRAIEAGRAFGLRHDGSWYHVGTPQGLEEVERELQFELGPRKDKDEVE